MTREEAISIMKVIVHMLEEKYDTDRVEDAVDMAIKALEQEPCEDCVSRAEAIKALEYDLSIEADGGLDKYRTVIKDLLNAIYNTQKKAIEDLPSIQPKPMQVDLEGDGYADGKIVYDYGKCPKCGWDFEYGDKDWEEPYCCHCGQKLHWFESEEEE